MGRSAQFDWLPTINATNSIVEAAEHNYIQLPNVPVFASWHLLNGYSFHLSNSPSFSHLRSRALYSSGSYYSVSIGLSTNPLYYMNATVLLGQQCHPTKPQARCHLDYGSTASRPTEIHTPQRLNFEMTLSSICYVDNISSLNCADNMLQCA